jgi:hypothetical protein
VNATRFPERLATGSAELVWKLGVATGRLVPTAFDGFERSQTPQRAWRTPQDLPAQAVREIIEQIVFVQGRAGKRFSLDAPEDLNIFDQIDTHFARAQRRKEREG